MIHVQKYINNKSYSKYQSMVVIMQGYYGRLS